LGAVTSLVAGTAVLVFGLFAVLVIAVRRLAMPPATVSYEWVEELCRDSDKLLQIPQEINAAEYLRRLEVNAGLTSSALAMILVTSEEDRPDLALQLLREQITFTYRRLIARMRGIGRKS
jgi:hypothetical protein